MKAFLECLFFGHQYRKGWAQVCKITGIAGRVFYVKKKPAGFINKHYGKFKCVKKCQRCGKVEVLKWS